MKKIVLSLVFVFTVGSINNVNATNEVEVLLVEDCFDFAISMVEDDATDDEAAESVNEWYGMCWCLVTDSQASGCF